MDKVPSRLLLSIIIDYFIIDYYCRLLYCSVCGKAARIITVLVSGSYGVIFDEAEANYSSRF